MSKWLTVHLAAVAMVGMAGLARAGAPPVEGTVECGCTADAETGMGASAQLPYRCTISPSGRGPADDINVKVTVRNVLGAPLPGATVVVTAIPVGGAVFIWDNGKLPAGDTPETPQSKISDVRGKADFVFDEGGVQQTHPTTFPNLDFNVTAQAPGPGGPITLAPCGWATAQLRVISFDEDATCTVILVDFAVLAAAYVVTQDPEADYNWDGVVNLVDFAMFTAHYTSHADCDRQ